MSSSPGLVNIARCPVHGLHGSRTECFVCEGPVEQVGMLAAADVLAVLGDLCGDFEDAFSTGDDEHGDLKASVLYVAADRLGLGELHDQRGSDGDC